MRYSKNYMGLFKIITEHDKDNEILNDFILEPDKYVYTFSIKEKNKIRDMVTYNKGIQFGEKLKQIHYGIARNFQENFCDRNENSFAYHKKIGCKDAIDSHLKSNYFIKIDIHHFFESITQDVFFKIYGERFNSKWTSLLKGCFYKNNLCIGFVTSPIISDFFMSKFDNNITKYIKENDKLHYSRYSDDILISSEDDNDNKLNELYDIIKEELKLLQLEINDKKTKKVKLDLEPHNSISFLGLNISKQDEIKNKVTISKRYILFLLDLIEKNNTKYNCKCKGLLDEINSRVAYLAYNSPISFARFQKKHLNKFGVTYNFVPKRLNNRKAAVTTDKIKDWDKYVKDFEINIHKKVIDENTKAIILNDSVQLVRYNGKDSEVEIPSFVDSIGDEAFEGNENIKKIVLNDRIKSIGKSAFSYCCNLEEIELPYSLQYIGDEAFLGCRNLKTITIPMKVKTINRSTFNDSGLENINLNEGLKSIQTGAFYNCEKLKSIKLPVSLEELEKDAFLNCIRLKKVITLSDKLLSVPSGCFKNCSSLTKIKFSESILSLEDESFAGCSLIKEVKIPKNIINIHERTFDNCNNLRKISVDLDNKVYDSRNNCNAIIETKTNRLLITTPNTVIEDGIEIINDNAYINSNIESIYLPDSVKKIGNNAFKNCSLLREIRLSNNITDIGESAFAGCASLKKIVIPEGVRKIKDSTFEECIRLANVKMPDNIISIGKKAFANNINLKEVNIPLKAKEIGYKAFANCYLIKEIKIPAATSKIMPYAFSACSKNLEKVEVDKINTTYDSRNNCNAIVETKTNKIILGCKNSNIEDGIITIGESAFAYCKEIQQVVMPRSVTSIEHKAFIDCNSLKKVILNKVTKLGEEVFVDCKKLEKADLPNSLVSIGMRCFANCESLKEVNIPDSIIDIGYSAFYNCKNLRSIYIPKSYKKFDKRVFSGCNSIEEIRVDKDNPVYDSREDCNAIIKKEGYKSILVFACNNTVIPKSITEIRETAFSNCKNLESIEIPENIKRIGYQAFAYCNSLKNVVLPNTDIYLEDEIFTGCENLNNIKIPEGIKSISAGMFSGCLSLRDIKLHDDIRYIGRRALASTNIKEITIPRSIKIINEGVFSNCDYLEKVDIRNNVKEIGSYAFANCKNIKNIIIPRSVKNIQDEAFLNNESLESIILPNKIKRISAGLFKGCKNLKEIYLPESINTIEEKAFYSCKSLEYINIPNEVKSIEDETFSKCESIKNITLSNNIYYIGREAFANNPLIEEIIIPASVTIFDNSAFKNCNNIKSIVVEEENKFLSSRNCNIIVEDRYDKVVLGCKNSLIPEGIKSIASSAFAYCKDLQEIALPNTISEIGEFAFGNCSNLRSINLPKGLKCISWKAFYGCSSLEELHIPSTVNTIGKSAFAYCSNSLNKISVDEKNKIYSSGHNSNSIIEKKYNILILGCKNTVIEEGVEEIDEYAFENCKSLASIEIPESLTYINSTAFLGCTGIDTIKIDKNNPAFYGVKNGNAIIEINTNELLLASKTTVIPRYVQKIYKKAFDNAVNLEHLFIPKELKCDLYGIFSNCKNLNNIIVEKYNPIYDSRNNCNAIIKTKNNELVLGCENTIIPEDTISIAKDAFAKSENLSKLYIPKNVALIDTSAFKECSNISEIVVDSQNNVYDSRNDCNAIIATRSNKLVLRCKNTKLPQDVINKKFTENAYENNLQFYPYVCDINISDEPFEDDKYEEYSYREREYRYSKFSDFGVLSDDDLPF